MTAASWSPARTRGVTETSLATGVEPTGHRYSWSPPGATCSRSVTSVQVQPSASPQLSETERWSRARSTIRLALQLKPGATVAKPVREVTGSAAVAAPRRETGSSGDLPVDLPGVQPGGQQMLEALAGSGDGQSFRFRRAGP